MTKVRTKLPKNPRHSLMLNTNKHLQFVYKAKYTDRIYFKKRINNAPTSPKLYSLLKNVKGGNSRETIVLFINSPINELTRPIDSVPPHLYIN